MTEEEIPFSNPRKVMEKLLGGLLVERDKVAVLEQKLELVKAKVEELIERDHQHTGKGREGYLIDEDVQELLEIISA